jgi:hypothetical protein
VHVIVSHITTITRRREPAAEDSTKRIVMSEADWGTHGHLAAAHAASASPDHGMVVKDGVVAWRPVGVTESSRRTGTLAIRVRDGAYRGYWGGDGAGHLDGRPHLRGRGSLHRLDPRACR